MANQYDVVIGLDPGVSGGISMVFKNGKVNVYKIPVIAKKVNKKNKKVYDLDAIAQLFAPYADKQVLYVQERVSSHPGEGSVSAFSFGKSSGLTIGMATAFGFEVVEVSSVSWKKHFPKLDTNSIILKKADIKKLRADSKTIKDKAQKKANKREIDKLNRQIKTEAKDAARNLAAKLYPDIAPCLVHKNTDGVAESLLIALFGRDKQDELVETG